MTRKYSLLIEGDSKGYRAYVPELPAILGFPARGPVSGLNAARN